MSGDYYSPSTLEHPDSAILNGNKSFWRKILKPIGTAFFHYFVFAFTLAILWNILNQYYQQQQQQQHAFVNRSIQQQNAINDTIIDRIKYINLMYSSVWASNILGTAIVILTSLQSGFKYVTNRTTRKKSQFLWMSNIISISFHISYYISIMFSFIWLVCLFD